MSTPTVHSHLFRYTIMALVAALLLSGCAAGSSSPAESGIEAPAAAESADGNFLALESSARQLVDAQQTSGASPQTNALLNRKMIARATLDMVVADTGETVAAIEALMSEVGGFISNENLFQESFGEGSPQLRGNLTLRVPAEAMEATLDRLEALAVEVGSRTLAREDVTDQYTDLDAQLRNLEATEAELLEMLAEVRAKPNAKPEDILAVHMRVMEIRGQIEQIKGRMNMLDNLIGLSTIEVYLAPDRSLLPVVEEGWQPGTVARDAMRLLVTTMQGLANFVIWLLVYVLPVALVILLPIALVILFIWWLVRRRRAKASREQ